MSGRNRRVGGGGGGGGGGVADLHVLTKAIEYPVSTLCNNIGKNFPMY